MKAKTSKHFQLRFMNLQCKTDLASEYKSGSQIARVLTEEWALREMYCPACSSSHLSSSKVNAPAIDFTCSRCEQLFQLKSLRHWNPRKIVDAGYDAMIRSIRADRVPNLIVLQYSPSWLVNNVLVVPRFFFSESVVEKRKPLGAHAKRAGWVGCNILLSQIAEDGKVTIVSNGKAAPREYVRSEFSRLQGLEKVPPTMRGWTLDVLTTVRRLGKTRFSLQELYEFEPYLKSAHPNNRNVRPKMRQQLQVLRDLGLIEFTSPGHYSVRH